MTNNKTFKTIEQYTGKSGKTVNTRLKHLLDLNIIIANGNKYDPKRTYALRLD